MHKPARKKYSRNKVLVSSIDEYYPKVSITLSEPLTSRTRFTKIFTLFKINQQIS